MLSFIKSLSSGLDEKTIRESLRDGVREKSLKVGRRRAHLQVTVEQRKII